MADEKKKEPAVIQVKPKEGKVDLNKRVKVEATDKAPHHEAGQVTHCSEHVAKKMEKNGWGKIVTAIALFVFFALGANAQQTFYNVMKNGSLDSAVVTNTGTGYVTTTLASNGLAFTTTVQARIYKTSGTVAGTITLQGSVDGIGFATVGNAAYATTATASPANVAGYQYFSWVLLNNPYKYYRLSYTGAGTMASSIKGTVWSH